MTFLQTIFQSFFVFLQSFIAYLGLFFFFFNVPTLLAFELWNIYNFKQVKHIVRSFESSKQTNIIIKTKTNKMKTKNPHTFQKQSKLLWKMAHLIHSICNRIGLKLGQNYCVILSAHLSRWPRTKDNLMIDPNHKMLVFYTSKPLTSTHKLKRFPEARTNS